MGVMFGLSTVCIVMPFLWTASDRTKINICYSGVNCALGLSKSIRYSRVCFHIFYCYSAGLSYVVCYNRVFVIAGFVIAGFVIAGCHCI